MKRMLSGIKPSGELTLGNYLGALKRFVAFQEDYEMFVFIANLHCITVYQEPAQLKTYLRNAVALYLACGLDPQRSTIFLQTDVPEHAQLGFILSCNSYLGELNRMTQYKDKAQQGEGALTVGFYTYPTLMAADILMYDPEYVPVGDDQKQHVELTRDIAERFNNRYSPTFAIPEPLIAKTGARIMSLSEPTKKMSKSDHSDKGVIYMLDEPNIIRKKVRSATTDSLGIIQFDPINQPGISNLIQIIATCKDSSIEDVVEQYKHLQYGAFKDEAANIIIDTLSPIQARYKEIVHSDLIEQTLLEGKEKAHRIARKKLEKVQRKIGLEIKKK
ncbi:MAG: tryptophan--tRNA ligase [Erysipelothrix sp.]|nr:tryptophan--tRNA ligase [Erysipelothrix sp.]